MIGPVVLGIAAVGLVVAGVVSAGRSGHPIPDLDAYLDGWSALHGGHDPRGSRWTRGWLALTHVLAVPLARWGVAPDLVTAWALWLAAGAVVAARAGGRWWVAAGLLIVTSALADGLDGAVAVLTGRTTRWGYVLDSVSDRLSEIAFLAAVWLAGGDAWAAVAAGGAFGLLEYTRARAGNAGMGDIEVVTVGERPTRVILCALALLAAGAVPAHAPAVATLGLLVLALLSAAGLVQLLVVAYRRLR